MHPRSRALVACLAAAAALVLGACSDGDGGSVTALDYATHAAKFPLARTSHDGIDCNTCHGAFDSFTRFDCLNGCHAADVTDPPHAGVGGYARSSEQCYACHPKGIGVDHELFFPIERGKHAGIACATCHIEPGNRKNFSCLESPCHARGETDGHHDGVGGYLYASPNCYGCHFRGVVR